MSYRSLTVGAAVAALFTFAASAPANDEATRAMGRDKASPAADASSHNGADSTFVTKAAAGGMAEVENARLALERAQSSEIKQHAQQMIDDHSKANEELKGIASDKNLAVPAQLDAAHKKAHEKLQDLSGAAFDKEYANQEVKDHQDAVALFKQQSRSGSDAELKQFASTTLPKLEHHLQEARKLESKTGR
jgi:putative membrane protein